MGAELGDGGCFVALVAVAQPVHGDPAERGVGQVGVRKARIRVSLHVLERVLDLVDHDPEGSVVSVFQLGVGRRTVAIGVEFSEHASIAELEQAPGIVVDDDRTRQLGIEDPQVLGGLDHGIPRLLGLEAEVAVGQERRDGGVFVYWDAIEDPRASVGEADLVDIRGEDHHLATECGDAVNGIGPAGVELDLPRLPPRMRRAEVGTITLDVLGQTDRLVVEGIVEVEDDDEGRAGQTLRIAPVLEDARLGAA